MKINSDKYIKSIQSNLSTLLNGHLSYAASLFLALYSTLPVKTICSQQPSVLYSHQFLVPKDRFDRIILSKNKNEK
jgi:hypothetical protein